jgi:hypothetical protein
VSRWIDSNTWNDSSIWEDGAGFRADWTKDDFYNYDDLNRVETNTSLLKNRLNVIGYNPNINLIVTNRDNKAFTYYDDLNRVESNILALRNVIYQPTGWLNPIVYRQDNFDGRRFDFNDANRLEINLELLRIMII